MRHNSKKSKGTDIAVITPPGTEGHQRTGPGEHCCGNEPNGKAAAKKGHHRTAYAPAITCLVLLAAGMALDFLEVLWFTGYTRLALFVVAYVLTGGQVLLHAAKNIAEGKVFNEFFLMGIATLGAFCIGEYAEGVAVMLFYVIGEHFQEAAVKRSRTSIKELIDNRPDTVAVMRNGRYVRANPGTVTIGQTIQVRAGEKVALDGEILSEGSTFNTAALTGESKPGTRRQGEKILAGMVNLDRVVEVKVTAGFENSALSKILRLVEEANSRKAKPQRFITRFARAYTPIVVFLAVALAFLPYFFVHDYIFNDWLYRALVFLVVSCPCALVISIPLGYFGGIGAASKNGILFKGSNFLDLLARVDTLVMDKTGTLTQGVFKVQRVEVSAGAGIEKEKFIALAAALENHSAHPVAKAVAEHTAAHDKMIKVSEIEEISGHGLRGKAGGVEVLAGNTKLLKKFNVQYDPALENVADTIVAIAINGKYAGHFTIADAIKEDAETALQLLRSQGVQEIIILSGDKSTIVKATGEKLSIDKAVGELLPQEKADYVEALKKEGKTVAFAGDGINDAPVITVADVGMAMGGLASDAAIESADVVIQTDQLSKIGTAITIGKKTNQVVWQNIGLAFGVKALVLVLGAFGVASLWEAVFADVGVALLAILNAVRLQRIKF